MSESPPTPTPPAAAEDLSGRRLGDFELLRRLGQGGMGQVYLAEQISLKRKVAVKILKPDLAATESSRERFRREAESVARATHANIVQVYAVGEEAGIHYMALEYVEGFNLREYLAKKGPPSLSLALGIMRQVAAALARAAELGIVHRDIKPENILLTRKGEVKVADFGLSRCFAGDAETQHLTQTGVAMGTPLYMSPEQVEGKPVDARADIYSFGATCYHLLAGQPPFRGDTAFAVALQHVQAQPTPLHTLRPDLPAELCAVVEKMMAKDPAARFQTGREILRELNRIREKLSTTLKIPAAAADASAAPTPIHQAAATLVAAPVPPPNRGRLRLVALSLLLALLAGAALAWGKHLRADRVGGAGPVAFDPPGPSEEERFLRREAELHATPAKGLQLERSLRPQIELGLFLLKHERWQEAEEHFQSLLRQKNPAFRDLGRLGRGIVLAFRDQPQQSNDLFLFFDREVRDAEKQAKKLAGRRFQLLNHPGLREWMARALDRNAANCETLKLPFPDELQHFRKPGPLVVTRPAEKQAANKR